MTKSELIDAVVEKSGITRKQAEQIVRLLFDSMTEALVKGDRIEIRGFGSFRAKHYRPYAGRNPKTGSNIAVEAKVLPVFKVGKELRIRVGGEEDEPTPRASRRRSQE